MAKYTYGFHRDFSQFFESKNMDAFKKLLNVRIKGTVKPKIIAKLKEVAQIMVAMIDGTYFVPCPPYGGRDNGAGNEQYPVWVGAMHDATGVALYSDGVLHKYIPTSKQIEPQHTDEEDNIWGNEYLQEAMDLSLTEFSDGIWLVLFCAVPYAWQVTTEGSPQGRGVNFFGMLSEDFAKMALENLRPLGEVTTSGTFQL